MRFMFIVKSEHSGPPSPQLLEAMHKLADREIKAGRMLDNGGLMPLVMGAQVRIAHGRLSVIDGPFVEAKEVIGGYFFLEVADIVVTAFPARSEQDLIRDIKPGAVVIDCSTEGNLHPDVCENAAYLSTHDNHLGQITTALALYNTALCALWQLGLTR